MTWGRKYGDASNCAFYPPLCTFEGMQARLRESYLEMGNDNEALVSPVGEAFKYSRIADSTLNLYTPDNSHPNPAGTYLAACTFYATLYQTSPVGLSYNGGLTANQAAFLQQIAAQTVLDSLSTWNVNEFTPQANFTYAVSGTDPYTYEFTSTSTNANTFLWSEGGTSSNLIHTFSGSGTYTISLTVSDGCTTSTLDQEILVSPLNSLTENMDEPINVNFQNQSIAINFNQANTHHLNVTVFDAIGNQVYQKSVIQNTQINTALWSKGVYIVKCTDGAKISQKN